MKLLPLVALNLFSSLSFAAPIASAVPKACFTTASDAVDRFVDPNFYDREGSFTNDCIYSPRGSAVVCEVRASKDHGAANDTFMVVVSADCKRAIRVQLTE